MMRPIIKYLILFLITILLANCGAREFFGFEEKKIPLPGKRVSILKSGINDIEDMRSDSEVLISNKIENINWEQTYNSPTHLSINFSTTSEYKKFSRIISGSAENKESKILAQPVIQNNNIYFIDAKSKIISYNLIEKKINWKKNLFPKGESNHNLGGGIALDKDKIFYNSPYGKIIALNNGDGSLIWKKEVSSPLRSAPTIIENRVLSLTIDNRLLVMNAENGDLFWEHEGIFNNTSIISSPKVAVDQNILIVPYSNGEYYGLNLNNGSELWKGNVVDIEKTKTTNTFNDIDANPVFVNNSVIIASVNSKIISLDKRNGSKNWARDFNTSQTPLINGNSIFLINNNKEVINLDINSGKIRWITKIDESLSKFYENVWFSPIMVNDKLLLVGGDERMMILNPFDGKIELIKKLPNLPACSPFVAKKNIYLMMRNGDVISIE